MEMTASPWIYMEIAMTKTIRKETPERIKLKTKNFSKGEVLNERFMIEYELELAHFEELTFESINELQSNVYTSPEKTLDDLYSIKPIDNKFYK